MPHINTNFISKIELAAKLPHDLSPKDFLSKFPDGGRIYRIFWLHCWQPDRFPIYDQHVHRAMTYMQNGTLDELEKHSNDEEVIEQYIAQYIPFFEAFAAVDLPFDPNQDGIRERKADRALSAFGWSLKDPALPRV